MSEATFYAILDWMVPWIFRPFILCAAIVGVAYIIFMVIAYPIALFLDIRDDYRHRNSQHGG